jgi:hypothetical protein
MPQRVLGSAMLSRSRPLILFALLQYLVQVVLADDIAKASEATPQTDEL